MLRRLQAVILVLAAVGCGNLGKSTADGGAGGGGGASVCDGKGTCNDCAACANANPCANEANNCQQAAACVGLDQCMAICGADTVCQDDCFTNNPEGVALYNAWRWCLFCEQCPRDCAGFVTCQ